MNNLFTWPLIFAAALLSFAHGANDVANAVGPLAAIADAVGTPTYVYSKTHFQARYHRLKSALAGVDSQLCYAVKANSNLSVLRCFAELGSGFDIVSGGELQRVLAAGGDAAKTIFSGVGKAEWEIDLALKHGIGCFNVESAAELDRIIEGH